MSRIAVDSRNNTEGITGLGKMQRCILTNGYPLVRMQELMRMHVHILHTLKQLWELAASAYPLLIILFFKQKLCLIVLMSPLHLLSSVIIINVNHTNIAWMSMLVSLTLPFYDFCGFRSSVYKLQFFTFILYTSDAPLPCVASCLLGIKPTSAPSDDQTMFIGNNSNSFSVALIELPFTTKCSSVAPWRIVLQR